MDSDLSSFQAEYWKQSRRSFGGSLCKKARDVIDWDCAEMANDCSNGKYHHESSFVSTTSFGGHQHLIDTLQIPFIVE